MSHQFDNNVQNVFQSSCFFSEAQANNMKSTEPITDQGPCSAPVPQNISTVTPQISLFLHSPTRLETHFAGSGILVSA